MTEQPIILVADDDPSVCGSIEAFLTDNGFDVRPVSTGQEALTLFRSQPVDLVLLDANLGQPGYLQVLAQIRKAQGNCPVMIMADGQDITHAVKAAGVEDWDCLQKPISDLSVLEHAIRISLLRAGLAQEARDRRRHLEDKVSQCELQLKLAKQDLEAKRIALREVLACVEQDSQEIGRRIAINIEGTILPMLQSLQQGLPRAQAEMVREIEKSLQDIASPFVDHLSRRFTSLSPAEIRICDLIRRGLDNKAIARLSNLSVQTIATHRRSIRHKLGISSQKVNMTSYLRSYESQDAPAPGDNS